MFTSSHGLLGAGQAGYRETWGGSGILGGGERLHHEGGIRISLTRSLKSSCRSYNKSLWLELLRGRDASPPPEAEKWRWEDVSGGARFEEQARESRRSTRTAMGRGRENGPSVQQARISGKPVSPATAAFPSSSDEPGVLIAQTEGLK